MPDINELTVQLKMIIAGDVLNDEFSLGMYATDASIYEIMPKIVVVPKDEQDVVNTINLAYKNGISILPRGGGTSLAGQTVGNSIVLDFSKYMTRIIEFNKEEKWVRVEPGLVHSELNSFLKPYGLFYSPDESTINRANIGGVVINNASGSRSMVFGKAIDHILEARAILTTGETIILGPVSRSEVSEKIKQSNAEGRIYKAMADIIADCEDDIRERFPKVMRRVSGYPLDEFIDDKPWNMAKILCGSEGTLAAVTEIKLNLTELPGNRVISLVHFDDRLKAIKAVKNILKHKPSAIELMDENVINIARTNPSTAGEAKFIVGNPKAILIVEFIDKNTGDLYQKHLKLAEDLQDNSSVLAIPYLESGTKTFENVWEVRKKGLGILLSIKSEAKPIPFIEDTCIPVENLHEYIKNIVDFCDGLDVRTVLYAHASVGVIHVRPFLNLRMQADIEKMEKISRFALKETMKYSGAFSGEHGDGLARSYGVPLYFGEKIYNSFIKLKNAFDPPGLMNPGKIIDAQDIAANLRYGADHSEMKVDTVFHYRTEEGFSSLANMCNGVGVCHRVSGGNMCPTYKVLMDESASTRGRANAIRLVLSGKIGNGDLASRELLDVLSLCISCKACKTECPSNVDVAKLKSEILQKKIDKYGYGIREFMILKSDILSKKMSGTFSFLVNPLIKSMFFRKILESAAGIDARRVLPLYAAVSLSKWYKTIFKSTANGRKVVVFSDTYTNYHEAEVGKRIITLLDKLNFRVTLIDTGDSKRALISNGFLKNAKRHGKKIIKILKPWLEKNIPVIVIEPGSYSALYDDIPDLLDDERDARLLKNIVRSVEHFLADAIKSGEIKKRFRSSQSHHIIHGHCHQKSLEGMEYMETIMKNTEGTFQILDAGCCGMAGAFGYEKEHFELSKKIYEHDLGAKLSKIPDEETIIATGFSCRHQIRDLSDKKAKHWAEVIYVNY
jgi:FAD/FMN-containing dehydrogenase/Fe-S oxidoreductase